MPESLNKNRYLKLGGSASTAAFALFLAGNAQAQVDYYPYVQPDDGVADSDISVSTASVQTNHYAYPAPGSLEGSAQDVLADSDVSADASAAPYAPASPQSSTIARLPLAKDMTYSRKTASSFATVPARMPYAVQTTDIPSAQSAKKQVSVAVNAAQVEPDSRQVAMGRMPATMGETRSIHAEQSSFAWLQPVPENLQRTNPLPALDVVTADRDNAIAARRRSNETQALALLSGSAGAASMLPLNEASRVGSLTEKYAENAIPVPVAKAQSTTQAQAQLKTSAHDSPPVQLASGNTSPGLAHEAGVGAALPASPAPVMPAPVVSTAVSTRQVLASAAQFPWLVHKPAVTVQPVQEVKPVGNAGNQIASRQISGIQHVTTALLSYNAQAVATVPLESVPVSVSAASAAPPPSASSIAAQGAANEIQTLARADSDTYVYAAKTDKNPSDMAALAPAAGTSAPVPESALLTLPGAGSSPPQPVTASSITSSPITALPVTPAPITASPLPAPMTSLSVIPAPVASTIAPLPLNGQPANGISEESRHIADSLPPDPASRPQEQQPVSVRHFHKNAMENDDEVKKHDGVGIKITVERPKEDISQMLENAYDALIAGNQEEAIGLYKDVLAQEPKNKLALFGLATTYHRAGQLQMARPLYGQLLAIDPHNVEGLNNFLVLLADEAPKEALVELERLEQTHPGFSPIPAQMAIIYEKEHNFSMAVEKMQQAINLSPENVKYQYDMAIMLDQRGDWVDAAMFYQQLLVASERGEKIPSSEEEIQERLTFIRSNSPRG